MRALREASPSGVCRVQNQEEDYTLTYAKEDLGVNGASFPMRGLGGQEAFGGGEGKDIFSFRLFAYLSFH